MKLDFLSEVPYVCERWAEVVVKDPAAVFLTEELSGNSYSRAKRSRSGGLCPDQPSEGRASFYCHAWRLEGRRRIHCGREYVCA